MNDILSISLIALLGLVIIGPDKLPRAVEALWLAWENLRRSQVNLPPLELRELFEQAARQRSPILSLIGTLRAATLHLNELRYRLLTSLLALVLGIVIAFTFADRLFDILLAPIDLIEVPDTPPTTTRLFLTQSVPVSVTLQTGGQSSVTTIEIPKGTELPVSLTLPSQRIRPIFTKPTEMFVTTFNLSIFAGIAFALPVVIFHILMFLRGSTKIKTENGEDYDGLGKHAMGRTYILTLLSLPLFLAGIAFSYFFMAPTALRFLLLFGGERVQALPTIGEYVSFMTTLLLAVGLSFETPLIVYFLAKTGVVPRKRLAAGRRYAYVAAFIIAAMVTPTPDPLNQTLVAIPMILLYELGLLFARF